MVSAKLCIENIIPIFSSITCCLMFLFLTLQLLTSFVHKLRFSYSLVMTVVCLLELQVWIFGSASIKSLDSAAPDPHAIQMSSLKLGDAIVFDLQLTCGTW